MTIAETARRHPVEWARAAAIRAALLALGWWVLTEGDLGYWGLALLIVAAATVASLMLVSPGAVRLTAGGLIRFVPFFLRETVRGSIDVAQRALSPRMPLEPEFIRLRLRLPDGAARAVLINVLSLLPGTLSVRIEGDLLQIHVLDRRMGAVENTRELERLTAGLFGVELREPAGDGRHDRPDAAGVTE